jgi:adenylate cyclase
MYIYCAAASLLFFLDGNIMTKKGYTRKLAAVLHADVKGYSRLMRDDEAATVRTLTSYFHISTSYVQKHGGRVVDTRGDAMLAEFSSVVEAVRCAVELQDKFKARNEKLTPGRRVEFRIGINLGDVIEEGEYIYGDAVNVAARVEGLAEGGGICISGTAYDQVEGKLGLGYEDLGTHRVKNIAKPVRVYRIVMVHGAIDEKEEEEEETASRLVLWVVVAVVCVVVVGGGVYGLWKLKPGLMGSESGMTLEDLGIERPVRPSMAVLPFVNMSGDPELDYLCDSLTENLTTAASKISELSVASRSSSGIYKGRQVKAQEVGRALRVGYVLEGSVQGLGGRVRVTAQLVDAVGGHHLWSDSYDRDVGEELASHDDVILDIVISLQVELIEGEQARDHYGGTESLEAWEYATRGYSYLQQYTLEDDVRARELFEKALEVDPEYSFALTGIGWTYLNAYLYEWIPIDEFTQTHAFERLTGVANRAIRLYESEPHARALMAKLRVIHMQPDIGITQGKKAFELSPANVDTLIVLAQAFHAAGEFEESLKMAKKAIELHPLYPPRYLLELGKSYRFLGKYEEAVLIFNEVIDRPDTPALHYDEALVNLISLYGELEKNRKARTYVDELLERNQDFAKEDLFLTTVYKHDEHIKRFFAGLRKAGIQ